MLLLLALASAAALDDPPVDTRNKMIPDTSYHAKRGDEAEVCFYYPKEMSIRTCDAALYTFAYEEYWKSIRIKDYDGIRELEEKGWIIDLEIGTRVLVLETEDFDNKDPRADCATVRVMGGPHKGKKVWVRAAEVVRLIPNPNYKASPAKKSSRSSENDKASASDQLLQEAVQFERDDALGDALLTYRLVVKRYPGTDNARTALMRIEPLSKKVGEAKTNSAEAKAKSALLIAKSHEKDGRKEAALKAYRAVVKDYPGTGAAKEAAERIKAME